jgi:hypothetical protein
VLIKNAMAGNLRLWLIMSTCLIALASCDLPIHCIKAQVEGEWLFSLGRAQEIKTLEDARCGFLAPSGVHDAMRNVPDSRFKVDRQMRLKLDEYYQVYEADGKQAGHWTMMYDEGMILSLNEASMFIFFKFTMDGDKGVSDCSKTLIGWYRLKDKRMGCFHGEQVVSAHSSLSKTSTGTTITGVPTRKARVQARDVSFAKTSLQPMFEEVQSVLNQKNFYLEFSRLFSGPELAQQSLNQNPPIKNPPNQQKMSQTSSPPSQKLKKSQTHKPNVLIVDVKKLNSKKKTSKKAPILSQQSTKGKKKVAVSAPRSPAKNLKSNKASKASPKLTKHQKKILKKSIKSSPKGTKSVKSSNKGLKKNPKSTKKIRLVIGITKTKGKPSSIPKKIGNLKIKPQKLNTNGTKKHPKLSKKDSTGIQILDLLQKEKEIKPWEDKSLILDDKKYHVRGFQMNMNLKWVEPKAISETQLAQTSTGPLQACGFNTKEFVQRINQAGLGWQAEEYPFLAGKSEQEINFFSGRIGSIRYSSELSNLEPSSLDSSSVEFAETEESFPKDFSHLKHLSPVKAQDICGNCYLIATVGMLEARIRLKYGRDFPLSTQYLNDCNHYAQGCEGGFSLEVLRFTEEFFVPAETCKAFLARQGSCTGHCDIKKEAELVTTDTGYYVGGSYGHTNEKSLMRELMKNGPIVVSFEPKPSFAFYKRGIYKPYEQTVEQTFKDQSQWVKVDHSVLLYGWGEENGIGFWHIRNSWGQEWGESGNFRIVRGQNMLGIESVGEAAVPRVIPV